jgi:hypothetical protein
MTAPRLHKLTALYLAVVYGVVGMTGGALHYLVGDWTGVWSSSQTVAAEKPQKPRKSKAVYHVHGPDFIPHLHQVEEPDQPEANETARNDDARKRPRLASPQSVHEPHACPLLSLVQTLKLSQIQNGTTCLGVTLRGSLTCEQEARREFQLVCSPFARGPPRAHLA